MASKPGASVISAPRLDLVPFTLPLLLAAQEGRLETIERALGVSVPQGWPPREVIEHQLPRQIARLKAEPEALKWLGRLVVVRDARMLAGGINVKGPPNTDGAVEIGYQIELAFRGQGYATEASHALVDWLFQQPGVKRVRAKCKADNEPSLRILIGLGMKRIGTELADRIGEVEIFEAQMDDFLPPDDG